MTTKTIYWIIGGVAVAVGGYFAYKHFTKDDTASAEGTSEAAGGGWRKKCTAMPPVPSSDTCDEWKFDYKTCSWVCKSPARNFKK